MTRTLAIITLGIALAGCPHASGPIWHPLDPCFGYKGTVDRCLHHPTTPLPAVPEPGTWALTSSAIFLIGVRLRIRRQKSNDQKRLVRS
jgi:hypothetical protein